MNLDINTRKKMRIYIFKIKKYFFENIYKSLKEIFWDSLKTVTKISLSLIFLWILIGIFFEFIPFKLLIKDTIISYIKEGSSIDIKLKESNSSINKESNSYINKNTNKIDYYKFYENDSLKGLEFPFSIDTGYLYKDKVKEYKLNDENTTLYVLFLKDLNIFHSKILLNLYKDEREAFKDLLNIFEKNKCTFSSIHKDKNFSQENYDKIQSDIKKITNLILIYFDKFDRKDNVSNKQKSLSTLVLFAPYFSGEMCKEEDLEKISK